MKKLKWIFLLSILIILSAKIVIGAGNGTPFGTIENNEEIHLSVIVENSGEAISGESEAPIEEVKYSGEIIEQEELETELNEVVKTDKEHNIMLLGKELDIKGEAKDLIMAVGANITSKALGSYAFMAASQLDVSGEIFHDTFAVGNNIKIEGNIGRDLYALGNTIDIKGTIERDAYVGGEDLTITGTVGGDVKFAGDSVYISSSAVINGDLDLIANTIKIEDGVTIAGTVTYQSNVEEIAIPDNINTRMNRVMEKEQPTENKLLSTLKSFIWWTIANFIIFVVLMAICPNLFKRIKNIYSNDTVQKYCSSCGWGLLSMIVIPFISILAIFTFIGSALGVIGLIIYMLGYLIATVITGYALANTLIEKEWNRYAKGLIGILMIELLRRLPIIGGLIALIVNAIAFGTMIKLIKDDNSNKEASIIVEKTEE